jgi:hypothetical protein
VLRYAEWSERARLHRERVSAWTEPYRARRAAGRLHPIYDFLFIYYRNKPSHLEAWHPGIGVGLEAAPLGSVFKPRHYTEDDGITRLDPDKLQSGERHRLAMALRLCEQVRDRPPAFACFGMHEWAMVYQGETGGDVRHAERLPLRLSQAETDAFVRSRPIQCSHFDAFRFFNPQARPLNRIQPTKETRIDHEQCGCLHTNMDLYKLAAQCMPWVGSELLWQCFEFAVSARQLDTQASPYDCRSLGFAPVPVETPAGKLEYERRQRALSEKARPLRDALIEQLAQVLS